MKKRLWSGVVEFALRFRHYRDSVSYLDDLIQWCEKFQNQSGWDGNEIASLVIRYLAIQLDKNKASIFSEMIQRYLSQPLLGEAMTLAESWIDIGEQRGEQRGQRLANSKVAIKLKEQGFDVKWICELTGLSEIDLKTLEEP